LLKPAALPIVLSEGIGVADADAGGCFGVKGYLQKQIPLPVGAPERALKTSRQRRIKQNRQNQSSGLYLIGRAYSTRSGNTPNTMNAA
jgi:hypothetical protein